MVKKELEKMLLKAVSSSAGADLDDVELIHSPNRNYGDYSTNAALILGKELGKDPMEIATAVASELRNEKSAQSWIIEKVEAVKPGFVNIFLSKEFLVRELGRIYWDAKEDYGTSRINKGKKIVVEYAHPNTHKDFHIGHLRNIILGESLCLLLESSGAEVIRVNYQGDVGLHVAKALYGISRVLDSVSGKTFFDSIDEIRDYLLRLEKRSLGERIKFLSKAYTVGNKAYEEESRAKKEIMDVNIAIYGKSNAGLEAIWEKTRAWSLEYFGLIYKKLGTKFDRLYFESEVSDLGKKMVYEALKDGILEESEGAVVFKGEQYGVDTRVFLTRHKVPTYEGKELGLAHLEFSEFGNIDKCIHVVAPEQSSFFSTTFKVEELLDSKKYKDKQYHFKYGYVNLKSGKMSSRLGTIVSGLEVINKAIKLSQSFIKDVSEDVLPDVSERVGVGAVKYSMLKNDSRKDMLFDFKESVSLEGNSGPYLQYTYARARSVLRKSGFLDNSLQDSLFKGGVVSIRSQIQNYDLNEDTLALLRELYIFPEVVEDAVLEYAPHKICSFLFSLAQKFNSFYERVPIMNANAAEERELRLALTAGVSQIIKNGLALLGIDAPERM